MPRIKSPEQKDFEDTVRSIRSSSDYSDTLDAVKEKLGLPKKVTDFELEALLIMATREKFKESLDADMALMALGLLKDFPNPRISAENRTGRELITARREKFIWTSSYVADRHSSSNKRRTVFYESCEDLKAAGEDAIEAVIRALNTEDGNAINAVAQKLYSKKGKINEYLDEAKEYLILDKNNKIVDVKLQELKCVRQYPVGDKSGKGGKTQSIEPDLPNPVITIKSRKMAIAVIVLMIILLILSMSFIAIMIVIPKKEIAEAFQKALEPSELCSIKFRNPDEWLPFGKNHYLTIDPSPDDATLDGLRCKSEGDNAHIIEVLSETGLHIKAIDDFEGSEPCNVSLKAYMEYDKNISDVVTIHVIKDGENESAGEGGLEDKSSGNSSQKAD